MPRPNADGRIGVNIFFPPGQDLRNLDALLTRLQAQGTRLVEQPADQARRQRHTADTYQFYREYAARLLREASPSHSTSRSIER